MPNKKPTGTREWAATNFNIQSGCEHDCIYCYAKSMAVQYKRATTESWAVPVLRKWKAPGKRKGITMFPSTHDVTPLNIAECLKALKAMLSVGNNVLIVSKPHESCIELLCKELIEYRDQILFRFTIGSSHYEVLKFWEPGAPSFEERIACLKLAYMEGFRTSISCEPLLDTNISDVKSLVNQVHKYVTDAIWIGRANRLVMRVSINCPGDKVIRKRAEELRDAWSDDRVVDIYNEFAGFTKIKWKDSIKRVVGIRAPEKIGMDI